MSLNSVKILYRYIRKNIEIPTNREVFYEHIKIQIDKFQSANFKNENEKNKKIKEWDTFIVNYLKMKNHIDNENKLLESYNINILRDGKKDVEMVARKVGLEI